AQYGLHLRQLHMPYALQLVFHLLLLVFQLLFVGQHLPFATAANTKMRTKRLYPQRRWRYQFGEFSFGPALFRFVYKYMRNISRYGTGHKQCFSVFQMGDAFAFGGIGSYLYVIYS